MVHVDCALRHYIYMASGCSLTSDEGAADQVDIVSKPGTYSLHTLCAIFSLSECFCSN